MIYLLEFLIFFIIFFLVYFIFVIKKKKNKKFNPRKLKVEEVYLIANYKVDFANINYKKHLYTVALINSFILAFTLVMVQIVNGVFWQIFISIFILIPLIFIFYMLLGKYYQKKGLTKNV